MKDSLIIVSGGMDSVSMLYEYRDDIALAVSYNYGANHNAKEISFAQAHCEAMGILHIVVPLEFMSKHFKSSLLSGAEAVPEGGYDESNMKSTVVPFRNGIMLSIACGIAESKGLQRVMIANHGGDHSLYPDCRPEFIRSMSDAMKYGTYKNIEIAAPYTQLTKAEIARRGHDWGLDLSQTWSCYKGGDLHCGVCGTCIERKEAFRLAGIADKTEYEK